MIKHYFDLSIQFAHTHSILFVFIVITSLLIVFIITVLLLNPKNHSVMAQKIPSSTHKDDSSFINTQDIFAIAGDDVMVTQLDLARAYIELDKQKLAKQILENVMQNGNHQQQLTAQQLLVSIRV